MERAFKIAGRILFVFITALLLSEYSGIHMYDTCLFPLNGQSAGLQGAQVFDLPPIAMAIVYIVVLLVNILSAAWKIDHITFCVTNLVLAIPVFLVLYPFAPHYPPFGNTEWFVSQIFAFLMFVYLSAGVLLLFGLWRLFAVLRRTNNPTASAHRA